MPAHSVEDLPGKELKVETDNCDLLVWVLRVSEPVTLAARLSG
jgi:hypothetical protein